MLNPEPAATKYTVMGSELHELLGSEFLGSEFHELLGQSSSLLGIRLAKIPDAKKEHSRKVYWVQCTSNVIKGHFMIQCELADL